MEAERRQHRRLAIRLPLECHSSLAGGERALRTVTTDISTGGLYFEADLPEGMNPPDANSLVRIELTVPPGAGYSPYEGRVSTVAEVLRSERLKPKARAGGAGPGRVGIAARFHEPLHLVF
jgi:hypothetical protein